MDPIDLSSSALSARILPRGAALTAVRVLPDARNLVIGFARPQDHLEVAGYAGALVGPVANRVSQGLVTLEGQPHQMQRNENGITALHSGAEGLHSHLWSIGAQDKSRVVLHTILTDGQGGLPGRREITATYSIHDTILRLEITAQTDKPTPMNIAAHPYWNLDGRADISRHSLQLMASEYTPTDIHNIPTGSVATTALTAFDFEQPKLVPLDPALDINICLARSERPALVLAARLTGGDGTSLEIATTAPGLQVYNGAHLPQIKSVRDAGQDLAPYSGIALEPQYWPDAPNIANFPQITLLPGKLWRQITTYQLSRSGILP